MLGALEQAEEDEPRRHRRVQHAEEDEGRDHEGERDLLVNVVPEAAESRCRIVLRSRVAVDWKGEGVSKYSRNGS